MHKRYRVKTGSTFYIHGHVAGRGGDVVEIDLGVAGNRDIIEEQADRLEELAPVELPPPVYADRSMQGRRRSDR